MNWQGMFETIWRWHDLGQIDAVLRRFKLTRYRIMILFGTNNWAVCIMNRKKK